MMNREMQKQLKKAMNTRLSVRKYSELAADAQKLSKIMEFCKSAAPLLPEIKTEFKLLEKKQVKCMFPWIAENAIAFYSEKTEGYLENAGFMLQQVELYINSLDLGACWLGMAKPESTVENPVGLDFVILLCFGETQAEKRSQASQFNRRRLEEISDVEDVRLEHARLAPSSCNSQPWFFTHNKDNPAELHLYCKKNPLSALTSLGSMNRIDMGIVLCHMYVSYPEKFSFFKLADPCAVKGHRYVGSIHF